MPHPRLIVPHCLCTLLFILLTSATHAAVRPNILWIIAEDFGPELSCYGHPEVQTPNIDRLAAEGVRFTRAFTVTPVCSTSRSSFMTGMYAFTIGAHNHRSHRDGGHPLPEGVRVLTDWLRPAGYHTANIRDRNTGDKIGGTGKTDWNFTYDGKPFDSSDWSSLKQNQPFYAQVNFPETHRGPSWEAAQVNVRHPADPDKVKVPSYYPDHPLVRQDWAEYLNTAMVLDDKVGVVLDQLEQDGLADSTVVVFFGDHGRAMIRGKQWPYDSGLHIPLIIRWPKSFDAPTGYEAGTVNEELIASIDLSATTLDWAGVEQPEKIQGRVFWGHDTVEPRAYVFGGRDRGDETVDRIRTVRDKRYRYIRNFYPERPFWQINRYKLRQYPVLRLMHEMADAGTLTGPPARLMAPTRPREELYDLEQDPYEVDNLAQSAEHQETLRRLRGELESWIDRIDDQGRFPESPEVIEHWERTMLNNYEKKRKN